MVARVEQCRKEFEAKASECVDLQRRLKRGGSGGGGSEEEEVEVLRQRVQELEVGQEEVQQSCAVAVGELTARQEEVKEVRISELEGKLAEMQWEHQQLEKKLDANPQKRSRHRKKHFRPEELTSQEQALGETSCHQTNGMQEPSDSRNKNSGRVRGRRNKFKVLDPSS